MPKTYSASIFTICTFNITRILYLQVDNVFGFSCCFRQLLPSITFTLNDQIATFLVQVRCFPVPD
ncbi:hypothetical protein ACNKHU_01560 [Shigella flexneri]